ncbi:hypothetical protein VN97_g6181 [Penicillium thymicola]|uniref:Uncharacterized protein n=1 Tax=Penicillium thymicola TaxID=293382 RepID=A0AAI9TI66_PENTH|nr:hypothetical protein VN97_g6181 [Penicillium thymicola]
MVECVGCWGEKEEDRGKGDVPRIPGFSFPNPKAPGFSFFVQVSPRFPISVNFSQFQLQSDGMRSLMTWIYSITPSDHLLIISSIYLPV